VISGILYGGAGRGGTDGPAACVEALPRSGMGGGTVYGKEEWGDEGEGVDRRRSKHEVVLLEGLARGGMRGHNRVSEGETLGNRGLIRDSCPRHAIKEAIGNGPGRVRFTETFCDTMDGLMVAASRPS